MAATAVAVSYFEAYARVPRKAQRKADEFLRKFREDPKQPSIHYEPLHGVDPQMRSVRVGDDYRIILHAPERGDLFLLLWVDHHDEAYRWAEGKRLEVHPATGTLQVFNLEAAGQAVQLHSQHAPAAADDSAAQETAGQGTAGLGTANQPVEWEEKRLFSAWDDDQLFRGGIPRALIPAVRAVYTDRDLDHLLPHLPQESADLLTGLAAGYGLDDVIAQILERPAAPTSEPPPPIDPTDTAAALQRESSQREFRLLDEDFDLEAALSHPLDVWRVYLHPQQRKLARANNKGPMRVTGAAGTGKTVVAMHRAAHLVRDVFTAPDDRVLFTTFTVNLATDIRHQLSKLLEPAQIARVEVVNLDAWASQYLTKRGKPMRLALNSDQDDCWKSATDIYGVAGVSLEFYKSEWREVIQAQGITSVDEYRMATRRFRGVALSRAQRRALWDVFENYRDALSDMGKAEPLDILRAARVELEQAHAAGEAPRYRAVVVDETQDFSAEALKLLRAIAGPEHPNDLFLVGDAHQRIYGRPMALSQCGINIRGRRSRELRLNYRTTAAICRWSTRTLGGGEFDDLDEGKASTKGYVSLRAGLPPVVRHFNDAADEHAFVIDEVKRLLEDDVRPEEICVVARSKYLLEQQYAPALKAAGIEHEVLGQDLPRSGTVRLATMHRVKGLEFPAVFLVAMNASVLPHRSDELSSDDPLVRELEERKERCLLYVAASRARDSLVVSSYGTQSRFLEGLQVPVAAPRVVVPPPKPKPALVNAPGGALGGAGSLAETGAGVGAGATEAEAAVEAGADVTAAAELSAGADVESDGAAEAGADGAAAAEAEAEVSVEAESVAAAEAALPDGPRGWRIEQCGIPARMRNWALRKGYFILQDLVSLNPTELRAEKSMGEKSMRESRAWIEKALGMSWEAAAASLGAPWTAPGLEQPHGGTGWNSLQHTLAAEVLDESVFEVSLPARMRNYCEREGIERLGDLVAVAAGALIATQNVGRGTVRASLEAIQAHEVRRAEREEVWQSGLLESFKTNLQDFDTIPRMVLTRRSGLGSQAETLESIASTLGVSRERVRQHEKKFVDELCRQRSWLAYLSAKFAAVLPDGLAELDSLAEDAWWASAARKPEVLEFICQRLLANRFHVVSLDGVDYLAELSQREIDAVEAELRRRGRELSLPLPLAALRELFGAVIQEQLGQPLSELGRAVADALWGDFEAQFSLEGEPAQVVAFGTGKRAQIIAFLEAQPEPVPVAVLLAEIGRCHVPDEVFYFSRGVVGVKKHFPGFEQWRETLVPQVVRIMQTDGPERQWNCIELLEELREDVDLPEWFGHWHLANIVRRTDQLDYLGRLRVALPGVAKDSGRIYLADLLMEILKAYAEPMPGDEVIAKVRQKVDARDAALTGTLLRAPFMKVDQGLWGLLERDVPGGADAMTEALDQLETLLLRRDRGLPAVAVQREFGHLSAAHAGWPVETCMSVIRNDSRFRISISGNVGLADWESVRVPTRAELVKQCIEEGNGRVTVEAIQDRIEAVYGVAPERLHLGQYANRFGGRLDGEWVVVE